MKSRILTRTVLIFTICFSVALAAVIALSVQASANEATDHAVAIFKNTFPRTAVVNVEETVIRGLFEFQIGESFVYFHPETKVLLEGDLYKDGSNLTAEKREVASQAAAIEKVAKFPYGKAIKIGNGKRIVIEISDPDCPYCRSAYSAMKELKDITKYIVLAPIAHPQAITKCQYVIDAKDKDKAYSEMMSGKDLPADYKPSKMAEEKSQAMLELAKELGINGTPTFFINGTMIVGADMDKIYKLLQ